MAGGQHVSVRNHVVVGDERETHQFAAVTLAQELKGAKRVGIGELVTKRRRPLPKRPLLRRYRWGRSKPVPGLKLCRVSP